MNHICTLISNTEFNWFKEREENDFKGKKRARGRRSGDKLKYWFGLLAE